MVSANDSKKTVTLFKRTPKQQMMLNCIALFVAPRTVSSRDRYRGCQERTGERCWVSTAHNMLPASVTEVSQKKETKKV